VELLGSEEGKVMGIELLKCAAETRGFAFGLNVLLRRLKYEEISVKLEGCNKNMQLSK
jgi:hypothetical protein